MLADHPDTQSIVQTRCLCPRCKAKVKIMAPWQTACWLIWKWPKQKLLLQKTVPQITFTNSFQKSFFSQTCMGYILFRLGGWACVCSWATLVTRTYINNTTWPACLHVTRSQCIGRNNYNKSIRLSPLNPCWLFNTSSPFSKLTLSTT